MIYTDFSKAFSSINHALVLHKLENYELCGLLTELFKSYLFSHLKYVTIGEPQDYNLGPIQFSHFINDMTTVIPLPVKFIPLYLTMNLIWGP